MFGKTDFSYDLSICHTCNHVNVCKKHEKILHDVTKLEKKNRVVDNCRARMKLICDHYENDGLETIPEYTC